MESERLRCKERGGEGRERAGEGEGDRKEGDAWT